MNRELAQGSGFCGPKVTPQEDTLTPGREDAKEEQAPATMIGAQPQQNEVPDSALIRATIYLPQEER